MEEFPHRIIGWMEPKFQTLNNYYDFESRLEEFKERKNNIKERQLNENKENHN